MHINIDRFPVLMDLKYYVSAQEFAKEDTINGVRIQNRHASITYFVQKRFADSEEYIHLHTPEGGASHNSIDLVAQSIFNDAQASATDSAGSKKEYEIQTAHKMAMPASPKNPRIRVNKEATPHAIYYRPLTDKEMRGLTEKINTFYAQQSPLPISEQ